MKKFFENSFYNPQHKLFHRINNFLSIATIVVVILVVLETVDIFNHHRNIFNIIEYIFVAIFTIEYIGRIIGSKKSWKYIFSFFGIVDFLAIIPTYLGLGNLTFLKSLRTLRILRFLRMLRLVKIVELERDRKRESDKRTLKEKNEQLFALTLEIYLITLVSISLFSATLMWFAEGYREAFANIPLSMIWSIKVLLGGVPQVHPETIYGEFIVIVTRFFGLVLFALLINIVLNPIKKYLLNSNNNDHTTV